MAAISSAQPFYRAASLEFPSARTLYVAKFRRFPRVFASADSNPRASVSARLAAPPRAEHVVDPDNVRPLDTTLFDGEQSPEATTTRDTHDGERSPGASNDKLLPHRPARLGDGVDPIEAGFPTCLPGDLDKLESVSEGAFVIEVTVKGSGERASRNTSLEDDLDWNCECEGIFVKASSAVVVVDATHENELDRGKLWYTMQIYLCPLIS